MSMINLSPEALELVNELCSPSGLEDRIVTLGAAEDRLQEMAYNDNETVTCYQLYEIAYTLKKYRKDLEQLKNMIEDGK